MVQGNNATGNVSVRATPVLCRSVPENWGSGRQQQKVGGIITSSSTCNKKSRSIRKDFDLYSPHAVNNFTIPSLIGQMLRISINTSISWVE